MTDINDALRRSAANAASCLAAAELAVLRGNFNAAKVFRAVALAERVTAVEFAKHATAELPDDARVALLLADFSRGLPAGTSDQLVSARETVRRVLERSSGSLRSNPDILESDVNQLLWGCHLCGAVSEGNRPETCAICGAPPPDLEMFAPFFAQSAERIGRLTPDAILDTLKAIPAAVSEAAVAFAEVRLDWRPSESEWSAREIVAHMTETDLLFAERARAILSDPPGLIDGNVRPWLLHKDRGYDGLSLDELLARHRAARAETLRVVDALPHESWARRASLRGAQATLLDFGTWIANHDVGHLAQLNR